MAKNIFVFVVCGSKEHIDTLHFSLEYLRHFSKNKIFVLTDSSRNEIQIQHSEIIDVKTPKGYTNHQASIYLKTGIHQFVPKGNLYCYLDTDVIAVDSNCNQIFNQFIPPIIFAQDHCKVKAFSPYAINCGCFQKCETERNSFFEILSKQDKNHQLKDQKTKHKRKKLDQKIAVIQNSFLSKIIYALRYYLSFPKFWLSKDVYYNKKKRTWHSVDGNIIKYEIDVKSLAKETNLKYTLWFNRWKNKKGEDIFNLNCNHLIETIFETFNIEIPEKNWQHWNGGVFLFNENSSAFLDEWHRKTLEIFDNDKWKTRDQGTLIANVWEFGLQKQPTLSKEWNFIADFHNNSLAISRETNTLSDDLFETTHHPKFVHVFHEWGNNDWEIWEWIRSKTD